MNRLFGHGHWDVNELTIDYRNPQEVSQLASDFAAKQGLYISTVHAVRGIPDSVRRITVQDRDALFDAVADTTARFAGEFVAQDGTGRVAVIGPKQLLGQLEDRVYARLEHELGTEEARRLRTQDSWDCQIMVSDTETVKGLEYDAVVVVEPALIDQEAPSRLVSAADLYVAMTRPTQRLAIVRTSLDERELEL